MRCLSKKAPCDSMSCWFIYTPHHLYSIWYIKVTIPGTLPKKRMPNATLEFLKLQEAPDKIKIDSVELVRQERKHARGY
jgi:hypothetical protein